MYILYILITFTVYYIIYRNEVILIKKIIIVEILTYIDRYINYNS